MGWVEFQEKIQAMWGRLQSDAKEAEEGESKKNKKGDEALKEKTIPAIVPNWCEAVASMVDGMSRYAKLRMGTSAGIRGDLSRGAHGAIFKPNSNSRTYKFWQNDFLPHVLDNHAVFSTLGIQREDGNWKTLSTKLKNSGYLGYTNGMLGQLRFILDAYYGDTVYGSNGLGRCEKSGQRKKQKVSPGKPKPKTRPNKRKDNLSGTPESPRWTGQRYGGLGPGDVTISTDAPGAYNYDTFTGTNGASQALAAQLINTIKEGYGNFNKTITLNWLITINDDSSVEVKPQGSGFRKFEGNRWFFGWHRKVNKIVRRNIIAYTGRGKLSNWKNKLSNGQFHLNISFKPGSYNASILPQFKG